jgi:hypothetical protein
LNTILSLVQHCFEEFGLIAQVEIAGNNSKSMENGIVSIGSLLEPSLLHGHLIMRGDPDFCYIGDEPLMGPVPGVLFNMRGDGIVDGNRQKENWTDQQMKKVSSALAEKIEWVMSQTNIHGLEILQSKK